MKTLIVIDWEKEWVKKDSDYYVSSDLSLETRRMNELIDFARNRSYKVIFVRHVELSGENFSKENGTTDFIDNLDVRSDDVIVEKNKISAFYKTDIVSFLGEADEVFVAGILTNLCVRGAVSDLYDRDFNVALVEDCCVAMTNEMHDFTLKDIHDTRPEVKIVKLTDLLI